MKNNFNVDIKRNAYISTITTKKNIAGSIYGWNLKCHETIVALSLMTSVCKSYDMIYRGTFGITYEEATKK